MRKIFLACPYGSTDADLVEKRFEICNMVAAKIVLAGDAVWSSVSMVHPINKALEQLDETASNRVWPPVERVFMEAMDELIVVDIDGWEKSTGVSHEIAFFKEKGLPVSFWSDVEKEFS